MNRIAAAALFVLIGFIILSSFSFQFGSPGPRFSDYYLENGIRDTGAINVITAIYLNYRAFDTLGEATVFFVTALGVFMLLRKKEEEGE